MIPGHFTGLIFCALLWVLAGSKEAKTGWGTGLPPDSAGMSAPDTGHANIVSLDTARVKLQRADTVLVVKHAYQHREQIVAGGVIMACLIGIMVVMNNYNPR